MNVDLHPTQTALLGLIKERKGDLRPPTTLRSIGKDVGIEDQPQVIAHHLDQLQNKGFIREIIPGQRLYTILEKPVEPVAYVNLYRSTAQCGPNGRFGSDDIVDRIPVSTKTFHIANPSHFFLVEARGKSMEPLIHGGDLVLAHYQHDVDNGQTAVVMNDGIPMIKKVEKYFSTDDTRTVLRSANDEFAPIEVRDDNAKICGLVKGVIRVQQ